MKIHLSPSGKDLGVPEYFFSHIMHRQKNEPACQRDTSPRNQVVLSARVATICLSSQCFSIILLFSAL